MGHTTYLPTYIHSDLGWSSGLCEAEPLYPLAGPDVIGMAAQAQYESQQPMAASDRRWGGDDRTPFANVEFLDAGRVWYVGVAVMARGALLLMTYRSGGGFTLYKAFDGKRMVVVVGDNVAEREDRGVRAVIDLIDACLRDDPSCTLPAIGRFHRDSRHYVCCCWIPQCRDLPLRSQT